MHLWWDSVKKGGEERQEMKREVQRQWKELVSTLVMVIGFILLMRRDGKQYRDVR